MRQFSNYTEFKKLVRENYPLAGIDELTRDPELGYWLDREMFRWYRLCLACRDVLPENGGVLLDVGQRAVHQVDAPGEVEEDPKTGNLWVTVENTTSGKLERHELDMLVRPTCAPQRPLPRLRWW